MVPRDPPGRDVLRHALAAGKDCLPLEQLEQLLDRDAAPLDLARHLESCSYCRTELDLLRVFHTGPRDQAESESVRLITERLERRLPQIAGASARRSDSTVSWWASVFQARWLRPMAITTACILIAMAVGVQLRHGGAPGLSAQNQLDHADLRSGNFGVLSPTGDIGEVPKEVRWQPAPGAVRYEVRLLEVDRNELWKTTASGPQADIPPYAQASIVPAKTLVLQVTALDGTGRKIAESEPARFRLLQNLYSR